MICPSPLRIFFEIPLAPTAQRRFRIGRIGKHARAYKDGEQELNEATILTHIIKHAPAEPLQGALELTVRACLPLPKTKEKQWLKKAEAGKLTGADRPITRPDIDNLVKQIADCMTAARFWEDDKQIVSLTANKFYSRVPYWEIEVREIE